MSRLAVILYVSCYVEQCLKDYLSYLNLYRLLIECHMYLPLEDTPWDQFHSRSWRCP